MENSSIVIPLLNEDRNYWLIRTEGGLYYDDFSLNDFVAISWNEIKQNKNHFFTKEDISDSLKNIHPYDIDEYSQEKLKRNSNRIASTINKFMFEIKKGDIIMIPSKGSYQVNFGEVLEDHIYYDSTMSVFEDKDNIVPCPYVKRRKVKWLKKVDRRNLEPKLFSLFYSHHTITLADKKTYASYIDRTIDSIFIKGNYAHLVLEVTKREDINAYTFSNLIQNSIQLVDSLSNPFEEKLNARHIKVKANVQSPGPIELFGPIKEILIIANIIVPLYEQRYISFIIKNYKNKKSNKRKVDDIDDLLNYFTEQDQINYENRFNGTQQIIKKLKSELFELQVDNPINNINSEPKTINTKLVE